MILSDYPCLGLAEIRSKLMAGALRGDDLREVSVGQEIATFPAFCATFKGKAVIQPLILVDSILTSRSNDTGKVTYRRIQYLAFSLENDPLDI